jgi:hypothetical protein
MWDGHLLGSLSDNEDDDEGAWDSNPNSAPNTKTKNLVKQRICSNHTFFFFLFFP